MSAYGFQVTFDAANPHSLAEWWAEALGWQVEPTDAEIIRGAIASGQASEEDVLEWRGQLVWKVGAAIADPANPERPRVLFQSVPEAKTVKNRVHLDIDAGEGREAMADKLVAAGASFLHRGAQGPFRWITLADPEGNEFCLC